MLITIKVSISEKLGIKSRPDVVNFILGKLLLTGEDVAASYDMFK